MNNTEIWKDVPNYEGLYQVSSYGRVKSLGNNKGKKEKILRAGLSGGKDKQYFAVGLSNKCERKFFYVHQIMGIVFLGHIPNGHTTVVDHKDGNKLNNRLENLMLVTNRQNTSKDKKGGSSKYVGVYWNKNEKKWIASIYINGKRKNLGYFINEIDAHNAYQKALESFNNGDLSFMKAKEYSSKYVGVCWSKFHNKWMAYTKVNGKRIHLGCFENEYYAHLAYQKKIKEIQ